MLSPRYFCILGLLLSLEARIVKAISLQHSKTQGTSSCDTSKTCTCLKPTEPTGLLHS